MQITKRVFAGIVSSALVALAASAATAETFTIDLTHPIPTFQPMEGDATAPDMSKPWKNSKAIPSFGQQTVLAISEFPTNQGHFDLGRIILSEHHGTHIDSPGHYLNDEATLESGFSNDRKLVDDLGAEDLTGRVVLIDISGRVKGELDKNGGKPSPDKGVTDFSNGSANVVGPDDVAAIADKLDNGVWLVLGLGWSDFYFQGADFAKDPYINGWNHPGMNKAAVDKLMRATGSAALVAASTQQIAYEGYQNHGVFTYALLRGLFGDADRYANRDGYVTINELMEYVGDIVPKITWDNFDYRQIPMNLLVGHSFPVTISKFGDADPPVAGNTCRRPSPAHDQPCRRRTRPHASPLLKSI